MTRVRKAVILAAGTGSRLGGDCAKPLTPVQGIPILHRSLTNLAAVGVRDAVVVVGHRADDITASVGSEFAGVRITYVVSQRYESTNNAYSLWLAREHLDDDLYLVEGDVVFDEAILPRLSAADHPVACAVAAWRQGLNGTVVETGADGRISRFVLGAEQTPGRGLDDTFKTINLTLLRAGYLRERFVPALDRLIAEGGANAFYELVLADSVGDGDALHAVDCTDTRWYEVDDQTDLTAAEFVFGDADSRLALLGGQHGGFWRHDFVDHCLLYNLHFPPRRMIDELAADFGASLVHYPVGHQVLQQLLAAVVDQAPERLVVANGASELIKIFGHTLGRVALAVPGFNEYEAVFAESDITRVKPSGDAFEFDVDDVAGQARDAGVRALIVTSPNNPTSLGVPRVDLLRLAKLLGGDGIRLVLDESFVEFGGRDESVEPDLDDYPNVVVVKSMSKVYGIGGLRLGYLVSADLDLVAAIRAELPIWNVNGIAETFLRLLPRYRKDFEASCVQVRADCDALYAGLAGIDGVRAYRPDANFVMIRLPDAWSGPHVVWELFDRFGILVKDCAGKSMPDGHRYLRVASRTQPENAVLVEALTEVLAESAELVGAGTRSASR